MSNKVTGQPTILKQIVADKQKWLMKQQTQLPLDCFKAQVTFSDRSFYQALKKGSAHKPAYILECKKASPSKGLICEDFNPRKIADVYKKYATVVSVLTDEKYFQGHFDYIKEVRNVIDQPVLCKDFIISEYQVYLARYYQADAILLMLSILSDEEYKKLADLAHQLQMGVLTETVSEEEYDRAIHLQAKVIGINNRNLHDLSVDLNRTAQLSKSNPHNSLIISESGIHNHEDVLQLQKHADGFLIGSSLMAADNLDDAVRRIIYGENKVCGLTRAEDSQLAYESGAVYGGLIFVPHSKRCISLDVAKTIMEAAPLQYVGVFQNQSVEFIIDMVSQLNLYAVQLHGNEDQEFVNKLYASLPKTVKLWKTISIDVKQVNALNVPHYDHIDRFIFDSRVGNQQGGTNTVFDWTLVPESIKDKSMLAGGLNINNIGKARQLGFIGLDINSGVESSPGIKDSNKLTAIFKQLFISERNGL